MSRLCGGLAMLFLTAMACHADESGDVREQLRLLQSQNEALQKQLQQQQQLIQSLDRRLTEFQAANEGRNPEGGTTTPEKQGFSLGKIMLSGEAGVAMFRSGADGPSPNSEFRVDEARLFVDAQLLNNVYFYSELNLVTREAGNEYFTLGELYLDIEDISRLWGKDGQLNLRVGRLDIPFGEEYLVRDAIDNPLIMHSLSDLWGYNEGIELCGKAGKFQYVLAVQNGGVSALRDFNADKSVSGRLGFDPTSRLHLSLSAMRTGELDVNGDGMSAMWFGNGFFRSIGNPATTQTFQTDLVEGDVELRLPRGHLKGAGGYARYDDNDRSANNQRDIFYYYTEGALNVTPRFYAAARFSQIMAPDGYPIVGNGTFGGYFYGPLTRNIWRMSLGVGFRWTPNLIWKTEYMFEQGTEIGGERRHHEDMLATELTGKF